MSNIDRAFSIPNGVLIDENNGGPFITGGTPSPVGLDLPIGTTYIRPVGSGVEIWKKFGATVNDWSRLSAEDITFDNTVANLNGNPQNVQAAIEAGREIRFQYIQFQFIGQMNSDQYLYSEVHSNSNNNRRSGDTSNGYQFQNSAPQTIAFTGNCERATASIRGVAQSTGTPAASLEFLAELWKVGFSGEGTKLGDITFDIDTSVYTVGNFWNSSIVTGFAEEQSQNVAVTEGDLLGLKFIRRTGAANVVSVNNATIVLEITGNA